MSSTIEAIKEEAKAEIAHAVSESASQLRSLVAGGVGGICAVIVGHPFDLVKVRLQTSHGVYSSAFDVVRKSVAKDGFRGLYAGVSAPLTGVTPMFMVSFWGYDVGKKLVRKVTVGPDGRLSTGQIAAAGFLSAVPMTLITAPFERVKVLLQTQGQGAEKKYNGMFDVVAKLYKEGGIRSVFRGSAATLARDGPGSAAYFATYEIVKKKLTPQGSSDLSLKAVMVAGGAAGIANWVSIYPVDVVKSKLQAGGSDVTLKKVLRELYGRNGIKAFFPGLGPALARAVPANAATFLGVEIAQKFMSRIFD